MAIFVAVFAFNLLTTSREPAWGDAAPMWQVADQLVTNHDIFTTLRWPEDAPAGRWGRYYGITPIGTSIAHLPGALAWHLARRLAPNEDALSEPFAIHVGPAALGALACVMFFVLLGDLGISPRTASLATVILAVATTTWVYARSPYSEILQLAAFTGWTRQVLATSAAPSRRRALALGVWAGVLLNAKYIFVLAIVGGCLVVAWSLRARLRELVRVAGWAALGGAPLLALAMLYNWERWGSVTLTGYEPYLHQYFGGDWLDGAWGMLASPNKSALLYSPPLILAAIAMPAAIRAVPRYGLALLVMVVPVFCVYCTYRSWSGEYAWGPRFFVWAVPVLLVPLAWFLDAARTRWRKAVVAAVVAAGFAIQLLGNALYWDHFIRISFVAKAQWLGNPNRHGAYIPDRGRGYCDSCFEDTYELLWTPPFNPIAGHWWLVRALAAGDDADTAATYAPWHTYTSLPIDISAAFPRARIDWWALTWLDEAPDTWPLGVALGATFTLAFVAGSWSWLRRHRAARESA